MAMKSVLIVGAGIAGLMAGGQLQAAGHPVILLDKGRGVGGRMATRRFGGGIFDHGAQFFTVRHERFGRHVASWLAAGVAVEWCRGFGKADGHPRYRGATGMTAVPKYLAATLPVHTDVQVTAVGLADSRWQLTTVGGNGRYSADALLLTPPVPQSLALLAAGGVALDSGVAGQLAAIHYDPCFALLARLDRPSRIPRPGAIQIEGEPLTWIADNRQKGISPEPGITVHAGPQFSRGWFEADPAAITRALLAAVDAWLEPDAVKATQLQRWRYSRPVLLHEERCLAALNDPPLLFAGDAFGEARVEGAALSGLAAADRLLELL